MSEREGSEGWCKGAAERAVRWGWTTDHCIGQHRGYHELHMRFQWSTGRHKTEGLASRESEVRKLMFVEWVKYWGNWKNDALVGFYNWSGTKIDELFWTPKMFQLETRMWFRDAKLFLRDEGIQSRIPKAVGLVQGKVLDECSSGCILSCGPVHSGLHGGLLRGFREELSLQGLGWRIFRVHFQTPVANVGGEGLSLGSANSEWLGKGKQKKSDPSNTMHLKMLYL